MQRALWARGKVRAAGTVDTLAAVAAVEHNAVLVHHDGDYKHLDSVESRLQHRWAVPRAASRSSDV